MIDRTSETLVRHGLAAMLVALFAGFMLTYKMIGGITLPPLPLFFEYELPGTTTGWRAVHLGMLMNGMMAVVLGLAVRHFVLAEVTAQRVGWAVVIAVWGNFCFYLFAMFSTNHGLTLGDNRLGAGNWAGVAAFLPAVVGAVTLIYAVAVLLRAPMRKAST